MYSARITRLRPTAIVFLIDQSGSMNEQVLFESDTMTKAGAVSLATNNLLSELINRSRRETGLNDYFDIAVIGYSQAGVQYLVGSHKGFVTPTILAGLDVPVKRITRTVVMPDGSQRNVASDQRVWVEPRAEGDTPMYEAMLTAYTLLDKWCRATANRNSYPPTVFNITDGEATDAKEEQLLSLGEKIKALGTTDGNALLINMHIPGPQQGAQVVFPASTAELPDNRYAKLLYKLSSEMPEKYHEAVCKVRGSRKAGPFRGMSFNTSIGELITMMDIGSLSSNLT